MRDFHVTSFYYAVIVSEAFSLLFSYLVRVSRCRGTCYHDRSASSSDFSRHYSAGAPWGHAMNNASFLKCPYANKFLVVYLFISRSQRMFTPSQALLRPDSNQSFISMAKVQRFQSTSHSRSCYSIIFYSVSAFTNRAA